MFDLAACDRGDDGLFEEIDPYRRRHEIHTFEFPAFPSQAIDDMTVQNRPGRVTYLHAGAPWTDRQSTAIVGTPGKFLSSARGGIGNRVRILLHIAPRSPSPAWPVVFQAARSTNS